LTTDAKQRTAIKEYQLKNLSQFLNKKGIIPRSIHIYVGTGSSLAKMKSNFVKVIEIYKKYFPNIKEINLGGGFAFDYDNLDPDKKYFVWEKYFKFISLKIKQLELAKDVKFILEPGRDVFADSGSLVVSVKRIVNLKNKKNIGTDGSYVLMPSATIRKRQHGLSFFDKNFKEIKNPKTIGVLSGCTTLSSDYLFPGEVKIPTDLQAGDYIVVKDIGAYGSTQHMEFLNKKPCPEVLIKENSGVYLITERGKDDDKIRYLLSEPKKI
jgi:diaminopimelate decarboxylase